LSGNGSKIRDEKEIKVNKKDFKKQEKNVLKHIAPPLSLSLSLSLSSFFFPLSLSLSRLMRLHDERYKLSTR